MAEIVDMLVTWAATVAMLFALINRDERRLSPRRLALAWPPATKAIAIVVLGVFCVPVHYTRTRRSFDGFCVGMDLMLALIVLTTLVSYVVEIAFALAGVST